MEYIFVMYYIQLVVKSNKHIDLSLKRCDMNGCLYVAFDYSIA